jgi:hypothetical protein
LSIENCVCAWSPNGWKNPFESATTPGAASVIAELRPDELAGIGSRANCA